MKSQSGIATAGASFMINARDFGAKGDGEADDTAAIQAALDAAALKHGTVFLPEGTYLTSTLKVAAHTGLVGNAVWGYRNGGGTVLKLKDAKGPCLLDIAGATGVTINGLSLHGNGQGSGIHGIFMGPFAEKSEEDTPRIERCHISQFTGDGIRLAPIWCYSIRSCEIMANKGNGLSIQGWDGFVLDCWFSANGGAGIATIGGNSANTLTGNRIEWNQGGGIVIKGGSHYNITGNYIDRSGGPAISILSSNGFPSFCIAATGNVIYRSGRPGWTDATDEFQSAHVRLEESHGITFTGNTMCVGQDDGGGETSPRNAMVLRALKNSVVAHNAMHIGALEHLVRDLGGHGEGVLIEGNVGSLYIDQPGKTVWQTGQL